MADVEIQLDRLEHAFPETCSPTIGAEIELGIIDRQSRQPRSLFSQVVQKLPANIQKNIHPEFLDAQIEYASEPHAHIADLRDELHDFVTTANGVVKKLNAELLWKGNFPNWEFDPSLVGDSERGAERQARFGLLACQLVTNSVHYHVAVPRKDAIRVLDGLQAYLPLFVALSANSPIVAGQPTGRCSQRAAIWSSHFPVCGVAGPYHDWHRFYRHVSELQAADRIRTPKDLYYFVRPSRFGTIELRCCDLPPSLDHVLALAALYQTLVAALTEGIAQFRPSRDFLRAELHDAITHGLEAQLKDHTGQRGTPLQWLQKLRYELEPLAVGLKTDGALALAESILSDNGAARQLQEYERLAPQPAIASMVTLATSAPRIRDIAVAATAAGLSGLLAGLFLSH